MPRAHGISRASSVPSGLVQLRKRLSKRKPSLGPALQSPIASMLYKHQAIGVQKLMGWPLCGRALLADEMGLGKTVTALAFAREVGGNLLILCPAALQQQWRDACAFWLLPCHYKNIWSYDSVHRANINAADFDVVIADEAHFLKDHESRRAQAAVPLIQNIRKALLLTGTPMPNRPVELWPLLVALRPKTVGNFCTFARRYGKGRYTPYGFQARGSSHVLELKEWLEKGFMVRRTQKGLNLLLPKMHEHTEIVHLPDKLRTQLANMEEQLEDATTETQKLTIISAMFRQTAIAKKQAAAKRMLELVSCKDPLIVFAHHKSMVSHLKHVAQRAHLRVAQLTGSSSIAEKHRVVSAVQQHKVDVAIMSMLAAGTGLNLTRACTVLFAELYWVPAVVQQSKKRVHRIGQTQVCNVHTIIAKDTCDERIMQCLRRKIKVQKYFFI